MSIKKSIGVNELDKQNTSMKSISLIRKIDYLIFVLLFTLILLYQLQIVLTWISVFKIRELLYLYLYLRIIFFYRYRLSFNLICIYLFLLYCFFIAINTYFLYGSEMAVNGFIRFVFVALLAPLASVLITDIKQVKVVMNIWLTVVLLGCVTAVYQFLGGDLSWLVDDYIAIRGGLIRFKTLLGEPNVGGMAAGILFTFAILTYGSRVKKVIYFLASIILLILSVSKAALAGFFLAIIMLSLNYIKNVFNNAVLSQKTLKSFIFMIAVLPIFFIITISTDLSVRVNISNYVNTSIDSFFGSDNNTDGPGILTDISMRLIDRTNEGIEVAKEESSYYPVNILVGSSYGVAGSSAIEIRGRNKAFAPHNMFLETYLVGGIILLALFMTIIIKTLLTIVSLFRSDNYKKAILIAFILTIAYMPSYPIIYQPVLGAFFWLVIGISSNRKLLMNS